MIKIKIACYTDIYEIISNEDHHLPIGSKVRIIDEADTPRSKICYVEERGSGRTQYVYKHSLKKLS